MGINKLKISAVFVCLLFIQGCGGGGDEGVTQANSVNESSKFLKPKVLTNESTLPNTVEVSLVAAETVVDYGVGSLTTAWAYNGVVPGPTIEAKVGDTLIVNFTNNLPDNASTTIHWHGVELPANMDGSNTAQLPIPSGGSFRYEFKLTRAATYWYHPHVRSNKQIELGLHGTLIVRDREEDIRLGLPTTDHILVLDDVLLDQNKQVAIPLPNAPSQRAITLLNGREGNVLLVNGKINPTINLTRGIPNRFRVVNVSNTTIMRISIPLHVMWRIGGDAGLLPETEKKTWIDKSILNSEFPKYGKESKSDLNINHGIMLTPGERADFIFTPNYGDVIQLEQHDWKRGRHKATVTADGFMIGEDPMDGLNKWQPLVTFNINGNQQDFSIPPLVLHPANKINVADAMANKRIIKLMFGHNMPNTPEIQATGNIKFFIKATMKPNPNFDSTLPMSPGNKKMIMDKPLPFPLVTPEIADKVKPDETWIIQIVNMTGGDHNFHLHGFMFHLIDTRYENDETMSYPSAMPATRLEYKDTILIPKRPGEVPGKSRSITRLAVKFDATGRDILASGKIPTATTSGGWVMHCHLLEHADNGMMSYVQVTP